MLIGELIHDTRIHAGIGLRKLADQIGIKVSKLAAIEHGRHDPRLAMIQRIFAGLNYTLTIKIEKVKEIT